MYSRVDYPGPVHHHQGTPRVHTTPPYRHHLSPHVQEQQEPTGQSYLRYPGGGVHWAELSPLPARKSSTLGRVISVTRGQRNPGLFFTPRAEESWVILGVTLVVSWACFCHIPLKSA